MTCLLIVFIEAGEESPSSLSPPCGPPDGGSNEWVFLPPNYHNSGNKQIKKNRAHYLHEILGDFNFGPKSVMLPKT